jgi:ATP-binding cassette subfamily C protein CydCD
LPPLIAFQDAAYAYGPEEPFALRNLHFRWEPGEVVVLTGPNGSGKSTCFSLLLGLAQPAAGRIEIDGKDLRSIDLTSWRQNVAFVPQRAFISERATIRDVVCFGREKSDPVVSRALDQVGLLGALEARFASPLDAPAHHLSIGQRQRLLLARTVAANAPVVLFDEPDAALDEEGLAIFVRIVRTWKGKSVAIAAHAPALIALADRIIRLPERTESARALRTGG